MTPLFDSLSFASQNRITVLCIIHRTTGFASYANPAIISSFVHIGTVLVIVEAYRPARIAALPEVPFGIAEEWGGVPLAGAEGRLNKIAAVLVHNRFI